MPSRNIRTAKSSLDNCERRFCEEIKIKGDLEHANET